MSAEGSYDAQLTRLESDLGRLVRRLRTLSASGWRTREALIRSSAQDLADLTASLEGHPSRPVPALPTFGLADAIAVLGGDVHAALSVRQSRVLLAHALDLVTNALDRTL